MSVGEIDLGKRTKLGQIIAAPKRLSLTEARDEFLGLIYENQYRGFALTRQERAGTTAYLTDLSPVEDLTLDAALVLTAEYHRQLILTGHKPKIDDASWSPKVRNLLDQLGFYSLVEATGSSHEGEWEEDDTLRFVPFIVGKQVDPTEARHLHEALTKAAGQEPEKAYVIASLVETIKNVKHHAYEGADAADRLPSVGRWWAAGSYDPQSSMLQFAVYDQGVGIPTTLPRRPFYQSILRVCPPERDDADLIAGALRFGRSRFLSSKGAQVAENQEGSARGSGLWSICNFIPRDGASNVKIISGRGEVKYAGGRPIHRINYETPFCGTLIVWNLQLAPSPVTA